MNMQEVRQIAEYYGFRAQMDSEDEQVYRRALSHFLRNNGKVIEAHEVLTGRYETSEETQANLLGTVMNTMDGRLPQIPEVDTAVSDMLERKRSDDVLGDLLVQAISMGINPIDLMGTDEEARGE